MILEYHRQTSLSAYQTGNCAVRINPSMEDGTYIQIKVEWHTFLSDQLPQHFIVTETIVVKSACIVQPPMSNLQLGNSAVRQRTLAISPALCVLLFVSTITHRAIVNNYYDNNSLLMYTLSTLFSCPYHS